MSQLSFDSPIPEAPVIPERPTAKQLTDGTFLACSTCGHYQFNNDNATGRTCDKCGNMATSHGARLAARHHYGIPLPLGVLDPLAANRLVISLPGPSCNSMKGASHWCAQHVPCWTDTESPCHMPTLETESIPYIDKSKYDESLSPAVDLHNTAAAQVNDILAKANVAQVELYRTKKIRDERKQELKLAQESMDTASRDNHALSMQLEKANDVFNEIKVQLRSMGIY